MNWGYKIAFGLAGFVALIGYLVVRSVQQDDIHLVAKDYYKKEIAYQQEIDKMSNTASDQVKPDIDYRPQQNKVAISFKQAKVEGVITFFRPSDERMDFSLPIDFDSANMQTIDIAGKQKGLWKVKIEWKAGDKSYYSEESLVL